MEGPDNKKSKINSRRSKKLKNLEQEVELILSQDESDTELDFNNAAVELTHSKTPSQSKDACFTPRATESVLQDMQQTPRRSVRKSIKPPQDYDEIVKKSSRSVTRSSKKDLALLSEENEIENVEEQQEHHKWSVAEVGRSSSKRSRKSRRTARGKNNKNESKQGDEIVHDNQENENDEHEEIIVIEKPKKLNLDIFEVDDKPESNLEERDYEQIKKNSESTLYKLEVSLEKIEAIEKVENPNETITLIEEHLEEQTVPVEVEQPEEIIHLIQEDSEDLKEFPIESEKEQMAYEVTKTVATTTSSHKEEIKENEFGNYLKSKAINFEDLGLNPIKDEDETDEASGNCDRKNEEAEEMPSLIVCDDEEENECPKEQANKLNETFEAESSVVIVAEEEVLSKHITADAVEMDTLQLSDDENEQRVESAKKVPRIMLTTTEDQNQTLLSTPKRTPKPYRFPTPYRNRSESKLQKENENSAKKLPQRQQNIIGNLTRMTPKEAVLRGIRKRSLSISVGPENITSGSDASAKRKRAHKGVQMTKMVNFYSPANQTAIIEDLDKIIAKSVKKNTTNNVTTRRKRSISLDETIISSSANTSRLPRPISNHTTTSTNPSSSASKATRTKLPNFSAIHQKRFQKMENLVEHVARKQERSKVLINSATKIRPASAQKNITVGKTNKVNATEKPKALKKIDISSTTLSQPAKKTLNTSALPFKFAPAAKQVEESITRLPKPTITQNASKPQQTTVTKKHLKPTQTFNTSVMSTSLSTSTFKSKPVFNLSTNLGNSSSSKVFNMTAENKPATTQDKMASRLQRHMDLFKGRVPATRAGIASRKNETAIRGVRSNRRFELQMQHRKNLEN